MNATGPLWPGVRQVALLPPGQVHVYSWDLEIPPVEVDWEILSAEETARARRFVFPRDRDRFVRAHAVLRRVLAGVSGIAPETLCFLPGPYGKPHIESVSKTGPKNEPIEFNLSHSADVAVAAVARGFPLGIDIERVRPIDVEIAEHHFSPRELRTLRSLNPERWLRGFFRCWTGKEALLKGEGLGLGLPLDAFDVEAHPERAAALLGSRPPATFSSGWRLFALQPAGESMCTLAVRDTEGEFSSDDIRRFTWSG